MDSNELAFRIASIQAFRQAYAEAEPVILEPIMKVEVTVPGDFQGEQQWKQTWRCPLESCYNNLVWVSKTQGRAGMGRCV